MNRTDAHIVLMLLKIIFAVHNVISHVQLQFSISSKSQVIFEWFVSKEIIFRVAILLIKTLSYIKLGRREDITALIQGILKMVMVESKQFFCLN